MVLEVSVQQKTMAHVLAEYSQSLKFEDLPEAVVQEAKRRVLDSFACAIGGLKSQPGQIAKAMAVRATPSSSITGASLIADPNSFSTSDLATFANGTLIRYLDFNDTYLSKEPAHPSDNLSAALAVAEEVGASGKEVLTAMVLGYEIQCRLCDAASIRSRGWDHVTYGAISTALLAGKLYGLSLTELVHAVGLAATPNVAMRQARVGELSHWKGVAFANAARNGVFAATLAKLGMTGPAPIFEGEMGFWKQVSGEFSLAAFGNAQNEFMILKSYIKHFPVEYHAQTAVEAALDLRPLLGEGGTEGIECIDIESFDAAVDIIASFEEHWHPKNRETADHSMPYCVAAALMDGNITPDTFDPSRLTDPALLALVQKVRVERSPEMNAGYPDGIPNRVNIRLKNGQTLSKKITYALGHPKNPMSNQDVETKLRGLAEGVLPEAAILGLIETVWKFETLSSVSSVFPYFRV